MPHARLSSFRRRTTADDHGRAKEVSSDMETVLHRTRRVDNCRPLVLSHLCRMTDRVGITQCAHGSTPDRASGYCVDDLARLGIVGAGLLRYGTASDQAIVWID